VETGFHRITVSSSLTFLLLSGCAQVAPTQLAIAEFQKAEVTFRHGDLKQALSEVDQALQEKGLDADAIWRLRLLKSEIFIWQGLSQEALSLLDPGELSEPKSIELLARRSMLRGLAESNLGQLDLAGRIFRETEEMPGAASLDVKGDLLLGEGKLAALRHDPSQSEKLTKSALKVAQENQDTFLAGKALGNLGKLEVQKFHYADAVDRFNDSLAIAEKMGAQATMVRLSNNLGWAYLQMGDLDRANELFEESDQKSAQLGIPTDQKTALMSIASIRLIQHDTSAAEPYYQRALKLARQTASKQDMAYALTDLAQVAIEKGDYNLAEKYNNEALPLEISAGDHDTELSSRVNEAQIAFSRGDRKTAESLLSEVIRGSNKNFILHAQAFAALAMIDAKLSNFASARNHFDAAIASLERGRVSFGREEFKFSYPSDARNVYDDYIDFLVDRSMTDEAFRVVEMHRASTLTEGLGVGDEHHSRSFDAAEAKQFATRSGHAVLSYWIGPERSYLWIFLPDHSQFISLPGEDRIRPLVEKYRGHLMGAAFDSNNVADASGQELYSILIGPVERWIKPQSEVTIIPDEELCGLNFETLVVSSPKPHYWIEDVSVTNASSAVLLAVRQRNIAEHPKALLLIGNPNSPASYPPLPHAGEEMHLIQAHFSPAQETLISGAGATPGAYLQASPENYALIHFVAHGTASRASALDSAVVLSDDGKSHNLYARDIATTRLHARLVTISACDSAGNRIYSSEGLVGLSWAFLRAGAQKVIAALWEVNDASTPQLMDHMYAAIAAGEEPARALRAAKLSLLRSESVYSRPYYWAPFVLYQGI
jgi:tetratricopeptide (TPR) repeat protein